MTRKVITRPNTGTSGYEMDLQELREKYDRVPDEEQATAMAQHAWCQVATGQTCIQSRLRAIWLSSG